jgi:hypothetical protein
MRKHVGGMFIKVADVRNGALRMQIAAINEGKYEKPDVVFETGETLTLNATNARILMRAYGPDSEDWIGKEIELYAGEVEFEKKMQPSVIVRPLSAPRNGGNVEEKTSSTARTVDPFEGSGPTRKLKRPNEQGPNSSSPDFDDDIPY